MKYLKKTSRGGVVTYIPLDDLRFVFYPRGDKYTVGVFHGTDYISLFDEDHRQSIMSLDGLMMAIADIPDRNIVDVETLFGEFENVKKSEIIKAELSKI